MSGVGGKNTEARTPRWESELWSYLNQSDGINCPAYKSCEFRLSGGFCLSNNEEYCDAINTFVDDDNPDPKNLNSFNFQLSYSPKSGKIFRLVRKLAYKYHEDAGIDRPPVPSDLITRGDDNLPIEIRRVPLKSHHGAVWQLSDCWLVQLSSNDTPARQRFTLYHEIFHILAHCQGTPVFKKSPYCREGSFNELLADHFAAIMLMPETIVKKKWKDIKDIDRMAAVFEVPRSLVWIALKNLNLDL